MSLPCVSLSSLSNLYLIYLLCISLVYLRGPWSVSSHSPLTLHSLSYPFSLPLFTSFSRSQLRDTPQAPGVGAREVSLLTHHSPLSISISLSPPSLFLSLLPLFSLHSPLSLFLSGPVECLEVLGDGRVHVLTAAGAREGPRPPPPRPSLPPSLPLSLSPWVRERRADRGREYGGKV